VDLVEDDELVMMVCEVQLRLGKAAPVRSGLQVQIDRWSSFGNRQGQRGLAGLSRAE
jgi:hypothetical protein